MMLVMLKTSTMAKRGDRPAMPDIISDGPAPWDYVCHPAPGEELSF
jgi:hypothetical protein